VAIKKTIHRRTVRHHDTDSFRLKHPIKGLRPADYNPRQISADALHSLKESITKVGFCKPIICMDDGLTIAGHQRTKAAQALGLTHVPAYVLFNVPEADQIRFNQLHNGIDVESINHPVQVEPSQSTGYHVIQPTAIYGNLRSTGAHVRTQICRLINIYGPWGAAVATQAGVVVGSPHYALCCKILGVPCRVYYIPQAKEEHARHWLTKQYGEFSYGHLPRKTYQQTFAQPMRLRGSSTSTTSGQSVTYQDIALPELTKQQRILDFGCGQADYVKFLRALGYQIWGIEFFFRSGSAINGRATHKLINSAMTEYAERGPFDVVICDSVLNSVDTNQAEEDVLVCLNALCKLGGRVFFSGRSREGVEHTLKTATKEASKEDRRLVEFLDDDGYSGTYHRGDWFFQKFHSRAQVDAMGPKYFGDPVCYSRVRGQIKAWQAHCTKRIELPEKQVIASLRREFDLPWPNGRSVGRADFAEKCYHAARAIAKQEGP